MTTITAREEEPPFGAVLLLILCGVAALISLMATAFSQDPLFRLQGWMEEEDWQKIAHRIDTELVALQTQRSEHTSAE